MFEYIKNKNEKENKNILPCLKMSEWVKFFFIITSYGQYLKKYE